MKQFNLDEYLSNPTKKLITRDGRKVKRILCTDLKSEYPVVAIIEDYDGTVHAASFTKDGKYFGNVISDNIDLFFASEKKEVWVNVYKNAYGAYVFGEIFIGNEHEEVMTGLTYIATAKIEWEE